MSKLADMKLTPEEQMPYGCSPDAPEYPYGLRLSLNKETLEKLGISELPAIGEKVSIEAVAEVVSANKSAGDDGYICIDIQITEMSVDEVKEDKSAAQALYGSGKKE